MGNIGLCSQHVPKARWWQFLYFSLVSPKGLSSFLGNFQLHKNLYSPTLPSLNQTASKTGLDFFSTQFLPTNNFISQQQSTQNSAWNDVFLIQNICDFVNEYIIQSVFIAFQPILYYYHYWSRCENRLKQHFH